MVEQQMDLSMHMEPFNLVKSLSGRYRQSDKEELIEALEHYKKEQNCSAKEAYERLVEENPSFSTYMKWRKEILKK